MQIRDATPDDLSTIVRFNRQLASESENIELDEEVLTGGVRSLLADPGLGRYYLAVEDGRVVGQLMTTYEFSDWRNGTILWIQSVYVESDRRHSGVFRTLYDHVLSLAESDEICGIRLYVYHRNEAARAVYERVGMVEPGYLVLQTPDGLRKAEPTG